MPLFNCKICGQIFECTGLTNICRKCTEIEEKEFEKVRQYVKDNPKVSMNVVAEETGVSVEKISIYLRRGLLEKAEFGEVQLRCQLCGVEIFAGNYCLLCMDKLKQGLKTKGKNKKEKKESGITKSFMLKDHNKKK